MHPDIIIFRTPRHRSIQRPNCPSVFFGELANNQASFEVIILTRGGKIVALDPTVD